MQIKLTTRLGAHYWAHHILAIGIDYVLYNRRGWETGRVVISEVVKIELSD